MRQILYVIVLPPVSDEAPFSLFQGFNWNLLNRAEVINHLCRLPATTEELSLNQRETTRLRLTGTAGYAIAPLDLEFLSKLPRTGMPTCVITCASTRDPVSQFLVDKGYGDWLHVTTDGTEAGLPSLWRTTREDIFNWLHANVRRALEQSGEAEKSALTMRHWKTAPLALRSREHNITAPTEAALESLGYRLASPADPISGANDDRYAAAIRGAAKALQAVRRDALGSRSLPPGLPTLIVSVPSVYRALAPQQTSKSAPTAARMAIRDVLSPDYSRGAAGGHG